MSIKFNDVSFIYSPKSPFSFEALKNVNVEIKEGSFTAIVGHTGSGKSTLVQHINGLNIPTSGTVEIGEFLVSKKSNIKKIKNLRKYAGIVFQFPEYQLFEETIEKDVAFGPKNFGVSNEDSLKLAHEALARVGLDESFYQKSPFDLSGGQKRRVAIAGIIALEPHILVLDEPTAGLDPQGSKDILNLFKEINKTGVTIILVTHDMDLVLEYADEVIVMQEGVVKEQGTPISIFSNKRFKDYSLDLPYVLDFASRLEAKGYKLDLSKIINVETLAQQIKKSGVKKHE